MRIASRLLAIATLAIPIASCGTDAPPTDPAQTLSVVRVSLADTALEVGRTTTASASGANAQGTAIALTAIQWSSSNASVASVSSAGVVTAIAPGTSSIIAISAGVRGEKAITVTQAPPSGTTGTLQVSITGLPSGTGAAATLTGPSGQQVSVTAAGPVALAPGDWTIVVAPTTAAPRYYPVLATQAARVTANMTTAARIAYAPFPVTGTGVPSLVAFDDSVIAYMQARNIPSGEIEVVRAGQTVLSRGYGWKDQAKTTAFAAGSPMRIASLTKPMTAAAIRQLVAEGKFSYSTPAFSLLGLTPLPATATVDSRLGSITVQQLLDHYAGFGPAGSVPDSRAISQALGLSGPPTTTQVAQYTMGRPLMYAPGSTYSYSNVGYLILGLIVEKMSQKDFVTYVRQNLFVAPFVPDLRLASTLPANRDAREPWYSDPGTACSVFVIASCTLLPTPDGGRFHFESFTSYGGVVVTPATYLDFMKRYWGDGQPRLAGQTGNWFWLGSIDGTSTFARWRTDGTLIVAFFNQRADASGLSYDVFAQTIDRVAGSITQWP